MVNRWSSTMGLAFGLVVGKVLYFVGGARAALFYYDLCIRHWASRRSTFMSEKAFVCERSGRTAEAIEYYSAAIELEPRNTLLYFGLACVHEANGSNQLALEHYEKTLENGKDLDERFLAQVRERMRLLSSRPN